MPEGFLQELKVLPNRSIEKFLSTIYQVNFGKKLMNSIELRYRVISVSGQV